MKVGTDCIGVGVGALIFNKHGQVLLSLRGSKAKNERGKWEIPGGAVEFGETLEQALKREVKEELGIEIEVITMLQVADHILPEENQHWVSPTFICSVKSGSPVIMEPGKSDQIQWFSIDEAANLPLANVTQKDIELIKGLGRAKIEKIIRGVDKIELPFV